MFRESDARETRFHPTYANKPVPILQMQSHAAKFDEGEVPLSSRNSHLKDPVPEPIPVSWDTYFDPSHPDADWGGFVAKRAQKKHAQDHVSQKVGIQASEFGLAGGVELEPKHKNINAPKDNVFLIGGIDCEDHWKTSYQALTTNERTHRNQMTLAKREQPRKRLEANTRASYGKASLSNYNDSFCLENSPPDSQSSGYQAPSLAANKSLFSNVGAQLLNSVPSMNSIDVSSKSTGCNVAPKPRSNIRFG